MPFIQWLRLVLVFSITCHGILLWRLLSERLARTYVFLSVFLATETLENIALLPFYDTTYEYIYLIATPLLWILAYLVVLELYRLILEDYPGIAGVGRKAVSWSLGLAVIVSIAYAIPGFRNTVGPSRITYIYVILERSIVLGLLLFLVLIQVFLLRYRLRLSPNRMVYATGYGIYFAMSMALDVVVAVLGIQTATMSLNLSTNVAASTLLLAGAVLLRRAGEVKPQLEAVDSSADRARLQQQLSDINRLLSRAARSRG